MPKHSASANSNNNERRYRLIALDDDDFTLLKSMLSTTVAKQNDYLYKEGIDSIMLSDDTKSIFIKASTKNLLKERVKPLDNHNI